MGTIRKQSLLSTGVILIGFLIGALNVWLFTAHDYFTTDEYGLTRLFGELAQTLMVIGSLGVAPIMYKFFPYYTDNLEDKENDLLTWCLVAGTVGFVLLAIGGVVLKPFIVRSFSERSALFVEYYFWIFPYTFFYLFFTILENYSWQLKKTVFPNFLKETLVRILTTVLIVLKITRVITYETFILLFSLVYAVTLVCLVIYIARAGKLHFTFKISRVTRKFSGKIFTLFSLTYGGMVINTVAQTIDSVLIAGIHGLAFTGIYNLATYLISLSLIPQRALLPISLPILSKAWKDKNMDEIDRIYKRSSINLLAGGLLIILNIWLGLSDAILWLKMNPEYLAAMNVVFILGASKLIDLGTGVNNLIIGTSIYWRFDFFCGVTLLAISIPTNYFLVKHFGMAGAAWSSLISFALYNAIRLYFLWKKFRLFPFTGKTGLILLIAFASYMISWLLFRNQTGFMGCFTRCGSFTLLFCAGVYFGKISPDVHQITEKIRARFRKG